MLPTARESGVTRPSVRRTSRRPSYRSGPVYVCECGVCGKRFRRTKQDSRLQSQDEGRMAMLWKNWLAGRYAILIANGNGCSAATRPPMRPISSTVRRPRRGVRGAAGGVSQDYCCVGETVRKRYQGCGRRLIGWTKAMQLGMFHFSSMGWRLRIRRSDCIIRSPAGSAVRKRQAKEVAHA